MGDPGDFFTVRAEFINIINEKNEQTSKKKSLVIIKESKYEHYLKYDQFFSTIFNRKNTIL